MAGAAPVWLRLTRRGDQFVAEMSIDGMAWTFVGAITLPMTFDVYAGLVLTSHDNTALAQAQFDDVAIEEE